MRNRLRQVGIIAIFTLLVISYVYVVKGAGLGAHRTNTSKAVAISENAQWFSNESGLQDRSIGNHDPHLELKLSLAEWAAFYNLRPDLLLDLAERESQWDMRAINLDDGAPGSHSYGLLQVKLSTARWILGNPELTADELFDVQTNIEAGVRYLKYCIELFGGDEILGIAAYRRGPTAVKEGLKGIASGPRITEVQGGFDSE